ncbi:MAG: IgGFc-binding protein, partial [Candidatus Kapaibacterium sp.]
IFTIALAPSLYELRGYNYREAFTTANDNEKASPASIRITTDDAVSVYALNKAIRSSDASLVLPVSCLGTEYVVMSSKSDMQAGFTNLSTQSTPSQFCVVAANDDTYVTITPSSPTSIGGLTQRSVTLKRGEAYLVQGSFTTANNGGYDLTGSRVRATKPVAVFGGHQRARIGVTQLSGSRDHLYEQLLPISVWGTRYVLTPFVQPVRGSVAGSDKFRVLAHADSTEVRVNGTLVAVLKADTFFEGDLTAGALLTASKKVMVSLYKKTAGFGTSDPGDPFMMVIPPRRQYGTGYRFSTVRIGSVYREHYITLTGITADMPTIRLDGAPLTARSVEVPNSCFSYVSVPVTDGAHTVTSSSPIGLYVYGYGDADSYGYVGGMEFVPDVLEQTVSAGPDRVVCPGSTTVLTASNAVRSVRWIPSTGLRCDTCAVTVAKVERDTRYIVTAADSLGCFSSDTIMIRVRKIPASYALRSATLMDRLDVPIGSRFRLAVTAASPVWDSLQTTRITATITYDPAFMGSTDDVSVGSSLPEGWRVAVVDSLSDEAQGRLVVIAAGDSAVQRDGVVFLVGFASRLGLSVSSKPDIRLQLSSPTADCSIEQGSGMTINLATCVQSLRNVEIVAEPVVLRAVTFPTDDAMSVSYDLIIGEDADVRVSLYAVDGSRVARLVDEFLPRGEHRYRRPLRGLSPGFYALVAEAHGYVTRQMIIVP